MSPELGTTTLERQFGAQHMARLAREFAFPCVPSMVLTWGYRWAYHMADSLLDVCLAERGVFKGESL